MSTLKKGEIKMKYNEITNEYFFKIFPTIQIRFSSSGYFIEKYQPRNDDYKPIAFYDKSNIRPEHIEELEELIKFMREVKNE